MFMLPGFKEIQLVHKGTNSRIFRAKQNVSDRPVIIKTGLQKMSDAEMRNFKQEFDIAVKIKSPNVIEYLDAIAYEDGLALVLEDIGGVDLAKSIPSNGISLEAFLDIAISITRGLAVAHQHNVIFNDIKPSNIIISRDGKHIKLTDFGSASQLKQESKMPVGLNRSEEAVVQVWLLAKVQERRGGQSLKTHESIPVARYALTLSSSTHAQSASASAMERE